MAEINSFISPKASKEVEKYNKDINNLALSYGKIATSAQQLNTQQKKQVGTQKELDNQTKAYNGLLNQLNTTSGKLAVAESGLNKELIRQKEQLRLSNQQIRAGDNLYKKLNIRLDELRTKARNAAISNGLMSKEARKARADFLKLDRSTKKLDASLGQHTRSVGNYGRAWGGISKVLGALGFTGVLFTAISAIKSGIAGIKQFGKDSAILAGVLGKTRKQITVLTNDAKRLGRETAKTAEEVLSLQTAYARLGFSQSEILDLTEDTIDGSIALNAELAATAELTGAVVNSFDEFSTQDASLILDQLTLSTQKSALNFEKLNTAIPIASGAAAAAKVPFSTFISQLGQAADRGIDASSAATSLRNVYITLADKSLTLEQALAKINSSQDRLSAANELFGKRAAVTALALANTTKETKELDSALQSAGGTAERVANEQLNTFDGRVTLLTSAYDGFVKSLENGDSAMSLFANNAIDSITKLLNVMSDSDEFQEGIFTRDAAKMSEENLNRLKDTLTKNVEKIESKWSGSALEIAGANNNILRSIATWVTGTDGLTKAATGLAVANKGVVATVLDLVTKSGEEKTALNNSKVAYDDLVELKAKLRVINDLLNKSQEESTDGIDEETEAINNNVRAKQNLYKIEKDQQELRVERTEEKKIEAEFTAEAEVSAAELADKNIKVIKTQQENEEALQLARENISRKREEQGFANLANVATLASKEGAINKAAALKQALIDGKAAVQSAFKFTPGPLPIKIAAAALAGIVQLKNVKAILSTNTAIPAFADGTESTPETYIAGEAGRELRMDSSGKMSMVNSATLFQNDAGSKIFSNPETERIIRGDMPAKHGLDTNKIVKAIERNQPKMSMGIDKYGIINVSNGGRNRTKYVNSKFRNVN